MKSLKWRRQLKDSGFGTYFCLFWTRFWQYLTDLSSLCSIFILLNDFLLKSNGKISCWYQSISHTAHCQMIQKAEQKKQKLLFRQWFHSNGYKNIEVTWSSEHTDQNIKIKFLWNRISVSKIPNMLLHCWERDFRLLLLRTMHCFKDHWSFDIALHLQLFN